MRVIPNYRRYEPRYGFQPAPETGLVCALCGYDIGTGEEVWFFGNNAYHAVCLPEDGAGPSGTGGSQR